ncbi:MAG: hypothetical protein E7168_01385 [Firmicutes bacterium]|nr:hypothetical protein [Bacillota bacterium]
MLKNEIGHFYDTTLLINLKNFVELFFATLADNDSVVYYYKTNKKIACLPADFKKSIETIMYSEDNSGIYFSNLINSSKYYNNQYDWEQTFSKAIAKYIKDKNKTVEYDFSSDSILIPFTEEEISNIRSLYDEDFLEIVDQFVHLVKSFSKNRSHELLSKEAEREVSRQYIRTGPYTWSK